MTFQSGAAGRPPRRPVVERRRRRGPLLPTIIILVVLVGGFSLFADIWTEVLWYQQLGYLQVYRTELVTKTLLFLLGGGLMAAGILVSLVVAYRTRPVYAPVSLEQQNLDRYREGIEPLRKLVTIAAPIGVGLLAGSAASGEWQTALLWLNRKPFGTTDPQFHLDAGFYVFTLPWLQFLLGLLTAIIILSAVAAVATHYLYGGLRLQGTGERTTAAARVHLAIIAALFVLVRGIGYFLDRYALATEPGDLITGPAYTDVHAVLPAKTILAIIAVVVALLFLASGLLPAVLERWGLGGWRLPAIGTALLVISAVAGGGILPQVVQRFQVTPSAQSLERPYIQRNITATHAAYGLNDIKVQTYDAQTTTSPGQLAKDAATIPGIRLLDPAVVSDAFRQLQQIKQYYSFPDTLSVDRYPLDGQLRDTVIAVREVDLSAAPDAQRNWVNDHTVYTHGFGVVAAYGNQTSDGKPSFFEADIPSTGLLGTFEPRIYFGKTSPDYSIVGAPKGTSPFELDYPDSSAQGQQNTTYTGKGGVEMGSLWSQLLFATKFRDFNILLSDRVNSDSRIMFDRSPRDRVEKVAPWLTLDGDPYPAVVDGRVKWIIDGYTTSASYPYSQVTTLNEATADSLTASKRSVVALADTTVNYIRNSVKATVDAYDGTVDLYAWDAKDPILKAWTSAFPATVKPMSQMSGQLMSHMRYPEDLFKVQRGIISRYHVNDPSAFFGQQDFWRVPPEPTAKDPSTAPFQPPYYLSIQMPGQDKPAFSLTTSFIPVGGRSVLTGFMAADGDAGSVAGQRSPSYGQIRLLELPRNLVVPGPGQVQQFFSQNSQVSQALNLLRQGATNVESGNLLTLPVGGGVLYVQPVYVRGSGDTGSAYPLLQKVLVAFGDKVGFADTLDTALNQVFGGNSGAQAADAGQGSGGASGSTGGTSGTPGQSGTAAQAEAALAQALADASQAIKDGQAALAKGDFTAYGQAQQKLQDAVGRALAAQQQLAGASSSGSATASPSPSPTASPPPTH